MLRDQHLPDDELQWVIHIRRTLEEEENQNSKEHEQDSQTPVSIFRVPSTLQRCNSSCYRPQLLGLGPYHRWNPELQHMERQKLSSARRAARRSRHFRLVVDKLALLERRLRASYGDHIQCNRETLAWAFAIDGCFLLELLRSISAKKCTRDVILRDLILLENQIPLWVLQKLEVEGEQSFPAECIVELVKEISPFVLTGEDLVFSESCAHLLEFLYDSVVPKSVRNSILLEVQRDDQEEEDGNQEAWVTHGRKLASWLEHMKPFLEIPWRMIASLPAIAPLVLLLEHLLSNAQNSEEDENTSEVGPLAAEEIAVPSAAELIAAGVRFAPMSGGPTRVSFDMKTGIFRLPVVSLNENTETTLRNLVAYEATSPATGPEFVARYVELMNGIVDSSDDVRLLRESGVVKNFMKNDEVAAGFWNGMSRSVQLTRVPTLDEAIKEVNRYYHRQWRVKFAKIFRRRKRLRFALPFVVVVLFFFMGMNAFCLLGRCEKRRL